MQRGGGWETHVSLPLKRDLGVELPRLASSSDPMTHRGIRGRGTCREADAKRRRGSTRRIALIRRARIVGENAVRSKATAGSFDKLVLARSKLQLFWPRLRLVLQWQRRKRGQGARRPGERRTGARRSNLPDTARAPR